MSLAQLETLVRARYPLILLLSWEEGRLERGLGSVASALGKRLYFWTCTGGLSDGQGIENRDLADPKAVLEHVASSQEKALFVLKDFHAHLQDPKVVRKLRDLAAALKSSYKTVILLSPQLTIPVELEKDVTVLDFPLPDALEIKETFHQVLGAAARAGRFEVDLKPEDADRLVQAAMGMTLSEVEGALAKAIVKDKKLTAKDVDVILEEKKQVVLKSRMLEYHEAREDMARVGGMESLKDWLRKRGYAFSSKAREFGLPEPKGVLILGVQGCGKSLCCKAVAGMWRLPLLRLDMGQIFGGFIGQSEENMRRAIKTAEAVSPCVLWLDEIEKGLAGTKSSDMSDAGTTARVFSTFLTWLQEKTKPVFVAATANNIQALPPELLRKGRLDEIFFVDLPSAPERRKLFEIHLARRRREPAAFDLDALAAATAGHSGAEIEQAVVSGLFEAFHAGRELSQGDLLAAVAATVPLSTTMSEDIAALRAWASTRARPASAPEAA